MAGSVMLYNSAACHRELNTRTCIYYSLVKDILAQMQVQHQISYLVRSAQCDSVNNIKQALTGIYRTMTE